MDGMNRERKLHGIEGGKQSDQPEGHTKTWSGRIKRLFNNNSLVRALRGEMVIHVRPSDAELEGLKAGHLKRSGAEIGRIIDLLDEEADREAERSIEQKRQAGTNPGNVSFVDEKPISGTNLRRITIKKPGDNNST